MSQFLEVMQFRHACKVFDESKKVADEQIRSILEVARLSPSSFGQEAWKFLVITNQELKEKLRPVCWNQPQITSCSHLVVVLAGLESLKPESGEVKKRFLRRNLPQEALEKYLSVYENHLQDVLSSDEKLYEWSARQTYLAAANMMTYAATLKIDSCPIEGFEKSKVEEVLGVDTTKFQVALLLPFGYRVNEQPLKIRRDFDEVVEFIS